MSPIVLKYCVAFDLFESGSKQDPLYFFVLYLKRPYKLVLASFLFFFFFWLHLEAVGS